MSDVVRAALGTVAEAVVVIRGLLENLDAGEFSEHWPAAERARAAAHRWLGNDEAARQCEKYAKMHERMNKAVARRLARTARKEPR